MVRRVALRELGIPGPARSRAREALPECSRMVLVLRVQMLRTQVARRAQTERETVTPAVEQKLVREVRPEPVRVR
jgi:hypothetical protein